MKQIDPHSISIQLQQIQQLNRPELPTNPKCKSHQPVSQIEAQRHD